MKSKDEIIFLASIVEKTCGSITPKGETYQDEEALENLDMMLGLINILLDDVQYSMFGAERYKQLLSVGRIFEKEKSYLEDLDERIREWIREVE